MTIFFLVNFLIGVHKIYERLTSLIKVPQSISQKILGYIETI